MMNSGIYKITNKKNGKFYIGSSKNIEKRWLKHLGDLKASMHHSIKLQRSYDKHGESNFTIDILEHVKADKLLVREQYYLDLLQPYDNGYNIGKMASGGDNLTSHPNKKNIIANITRAVRKRYKQMTLEDRKKYSDKMKGENNPNYGNKWNEAQRQKMSERRMGQRSSKATREKISKIVKKRWESEEYKDKQSKRMTGSGNPFYGKQHSEETKQKIREKNSGRQHTEEAKKKISKASKQFYKSEAGQKFKQDLSSRVSGENHFLYGVGHTDDSKKKMEESHRRKWEQMTKEDFLQLQYIKIIRANEHFYLGLNLAAKKLGLSACALTYRCKSNKHKWDGFQFINRGDLQDEQIDRLIWR